MSRSLRLEAELAVSAVGENLRQVSNIVITGPHQMVRQVFLMMPAVTADDWAVIARRLGRVPRALAGYRSSLAQGTARGLYAAPRLVETVAGQLAGWQQSGGGRGWFTGFVAGAPAGLRSDLEAAGAAADAAVAGLRDWLGPDYPAGAAGTADGVGQERHRVSVRRWNGTDPDLTEAYEWGWSQYREILAEMAAEAGRVLPGSSAREAMGYLDSAGEVVEGVEAVRDRLQQLTDEAMARLAGTHFDLAEPVRKVEARIAPPGSAAAPFCTPPSRDFSRPGQTWFPTLGKTSFPMWNLYSTWYHEGVPCHHLQGAQWVYLSDRLSAYQTSLGLVSACVEGWALYAERLMDELGFLEPFGARLGYLDGQLIRAIRVIIDIGMHLRLPIPREWAPGAGQRWTPELALEFFASHSSRPQDYLASEVDRYLSMPGQAISTSSGNAPGWRAGPRPGPRVAPAST